MASSDEIDSLCVGACSSEENRDAPAATYGDHPEPKSLLDGVAGFPSVHHLEPAVGEEKQPDGGSNLHATLQCAAGESEGPVVKTARRRIGRNDFGCPEDRIVEIALTANVPAGMTMRFRNVRTGDVVDSDGTALWSAGTNRDASHDYHLEQIESFECLGTAP